MAILILLFMGGSLQPAGRQAPAARPEGGLNMGKPTTEYYKISSRQDVVAGGHVLLDRRVGHSRVSQLDGALISRDSRVKASVFLCLSKKSWAMGCSKK